MTLDVMSNSPFVSQANTRISKENLVFNQTSLGAFYTHSFNYVLLILLNNYSLLPSSITASKNCYTLTLLKIYLYKIIICYIVHFHVSL